MISEYACSYCDAIELINYPFEKKYCRIYIGSTFCERYFIHTPSVLWMDAYHLAHGAGIKVSLVVPIAGQAHLQKLKEKMEWLFDLFQEDLDEVVLNDYGMLAWIGKNHPNYSLWLGRMLVKDTRDPRYTMEHNECKLLENMSSGRLYGFDITGIELDAFEPFAAAPNGDIILGVHLPYGYISAGRLCEIGSIGKETKNKFRLTADCSRQCVHTWLLFENDGVELLKYGRAVYSPIKADKVLDSLPPQAKVRFITDCFAAKVIPQGDVCLKEVR